MTEWKLGRKNEARDNYHRAIARMEVTYPADPGYARMHEEASQLLGIQP